jgi:RNA polymerase subunit RPABC4/transcription elongation factor Spt4
VKREERVKVCLHCERISRGTRSAPNICAVCGEELVTMLRSEYEQGRGEE